MMNKAALEETISIEMPAGLKYTPLARHIVGAICSEVGFSQSERKKVELAVDESCINICKYAMNQNRNISRYKIEVKSEKKLIKIKISYEGNSYQFLQRSKSEIEEQLREMKGGGLGLYFIQNVMDNVHYEYRDNTNIITMEKKMGAFGNNGLDQ